MKIIDLDDEADEDAFEIVNGVKVLKDHRGFRVPMRMCDSAQRIIRAHLQQNFPDFVHVDDSDGARAKAREDYEQSLTGAWRHPTGLTRDSNDEFRSAQIGDICTVHNAEFPNDQGAPGHLEMRGDQLICVPDRKRDSTPLTDARDHAYRDYVNWLTQAYRGQR